MNSTSEYSLTIVVPVFNEEDNIRNLEKALAEFIPVSKVKTCVLFVDDGSSDGSLRLILETCQRQRDFFYISFSRNAGLSAAIKAGFDHTFSEYVGYMDADLQTSPQDFNLLIDGMKVHTLMTGYRADRKDTAFKRMHRFLPALILLQDGGSFGEVAVRHFPRSAGKSKFNLRNRFWGPLADCFAYRWMRPRYINYSVGKSDLQEQGQPVK